MSSFYTSVSCHKLIDSEGKVLDKEQAMPILLRRISGLSKNAVDELWLWQQNVIDPVGTTDEVTEDEFDATRLKLAQEYLISNLSVLFEEDWPYGDVVTIKRNGRPCASTGGLSYGDSPTEAYDLIETIGASKITVRCSDDSYWVNPSLRAAIAEFLRVQKITPSKFGYDEALHRAAVTFDSCEL